jgi:hypothetical protein
LDEPSRTTSGLLVSETVRVIELQPELVQFLAVKEQLVVGAHVVIVDGVVYEVLFTPELVRI